jgi:tight adherence protein C
VSADDLVQLAAAYLTIGLGPITVSPVETAIIVLALTAALVSALHLWRIGYREQRQARFAALRSTRSDEAQSAVSRNPSWHRLFGALVAASPIVGRTEQERLLNLLAKAGIKGQGNLASVVAAKVCGGLALAAVLWLAVAETEASSYVIVEFIAALAGFMLGWRLPDIILGRLAARRRVQLDTGMPDALDLLVICSEAGLSLDQSIEQISRDLTVSNPAVATEFAETAAELRVQADVGVVLDNLAQRTGLDTLRGMIATLKQSLRFGTPLAESLRVLAAEMRSARQARMEERAARLPVLLAIPLMLFILPSLFMIIGTPVALRILDTFKALHIGQP